MEARHEVSAAAMPRNHMKGMVLDAERMQWLEQNVDIEIGREDDDGDTVRVVYRVSGSRNDRQWTPIGRGSTLTAAIDAARAIYDASRIAAPAKAARIERLSERQKEVLRRGAEGLSLRGKYQWICAGEPATREVNALVKRKLMRIGEFGGGRAAANATDAGREALAATTHRN